MSVFYPSCRVRLVVRFDEGADTRTLERQIETDVVPSGTPSLVSTDIQASIDTLTEELRQTLREREVLPPNEFDQRLADIQRRRRRTQQRLSREPLPAAISETPPDDLTTILNSFPMTASIARNGLRAPDTASIKIAHRDAPFDPRSIRSCAVEITMGAVPADEYARGQRGEFREDGAPFGVVPRVPAGAPAAPGTTRFFGFVDNWGIDRDDDGDFVELTCRDLTSLMFDQKLPPGIGIDTALPIDEGISNLLNLFPSMRGTVVEWTGDGDAPSLAGSMAPSRRPRRRQAPQRRARSGSENMNVWEHIVETCIQAAVVPVFVGNTLRVIEPRTFYSGGTARVMVYGRNLKRLSFTRKLGGNKVPTIEVRSQDPSIGRMRWARFPVAPNEGASGIFGVTDPPRPSRASNVQPSGVADDKIKTFVLQVTDPEAMVRAAESIWHELGRKEIEGTIETNEIAAYVRPDNPSQPISPQDPMVGDLLTLEVGDAIELLIAQASVIPAPGETNISSAEIAALDAESRARYLQSIGWSREVAERFASLQDAQSLQTVFRVQTVDLSFDSETGIIVNCDFINFLEIRETP